MSEPRRRGTGPESREEACTVEQENGERRGRWRHRGWDDGPLGGRSAGPGNGCRWLWLCESLDGLTDDEYVWRPTADTLTLDQLLPPESEDWRTYYAKFPSPPPLSTIEHKVGHVATCKLMYAEYAFREGRLSWRWSDLRVPRTLDAMQAYLGDAHRMLRGYLDALVDTDLRTRRKTNWGEHWPAERILWVIRTMRAFYRSIRHA